MHSHKSLAYKITYRYSQMALAQHSKRAPQRRLAHLASQGQASSGRHDQWPWLTCTSRRSPSVAAAARTPSSGEREEEPSRRSDTG